MEKRGKAGIAFAVIIVVLGIFLAIGSRLWFSACGIQEDGSYMACHWAELTSSFLGIVLAVQGAIALLIRDKKAQGAVFAAAAPVALLTCFIPGTIISICAMSGMHCRAMLRPAVIAIGIVITVIALLGAFIGLKGKKEDEDE